jgi:hypothetical protein
VVALAALGVDAAVASADSASLSFTDAAGTSDPVAGVGRTATLSGNTQSSTRIWIRNRASGGAPCAPSASSDSGSVYFDGNFSGSEFYGTDVNGNFALKRTGTWRTAGTYMFCIWIAPSESTSTTPITQNVTFRQPSGTISATVAPVTPRPGQAATVTVTGASEAPEGVYATIRKAGGAACAASYSADSGYTLIGGTDVNGSFSLHASTTQNAGNYLICLWVAASSSDSTPIAGPQPVTFSVVAPPPPCRVPVLRNLTLARAKARLVASGCRVGRVSYVRSSLKRGRVVRTSPGAGKHRAAGASVSVVLSRGPR